MGFSDDPIPTIPINIIAIDNAIRTKECTFQQIHYNNFASRILSLPTPTWEYPSDWPNPQTLIDEAIADCGESIKGACVYFLDNSFNAPEFSCVKFAYASDGQKIEAAGGTANQVVTFDESHWITTANGLRLRWVVILQDLADNSVGITSQTYLPPSTINIYVSNTCYRIFSISAAILHTHRNIQSIVFGRDNSDGINYFYHGTFNTATAIAQSCLSWIGLVNAAYRCQTAAMVNCFTSNRYMKIPPVFIMATNATTHTNVMSETYSVRGKVECPVTASSSSFQNAYQNSGLEEMYFSKLNGNLTMSVASGFFSYNRLCQKITCAFPNSKIIFPAAAGGVMRECNNLVSIDLILDFTATTSAASSIIADYSLDLPWRLVTARIILPKINCVMEKSLRSADLTTMTYLADNCPDVTAAPKTLTIGADKINFCGGAGGAIITALTNNGWVVA